MSGYTVKPPTGDSNEQTQFIDYFNLFYSKRGQEQISISQQLGKFIPTGVAMQYYHLRQNIEKIVSLLTRIPLQIMLNWMKP